MHLHPNCGSCVLQYLTGKQKKNSVERRATRTPEEKIRKRTPDAHVERYQRALAFHKAGALMQDGTWSIRSNLPRAVSESGPEGTRTPRLISLLVEAVVCFMKCAHCDATELPTSVKNCTCTMLCATVAPCQKIPRRFYYHKRTSRCEKRP